MPAPDRLTCLETLRRVVADGASLARFGDGECRMAYSDKPLLFQRPDPALRARLHQALVEPKPGLIPCFNHYYHDHLMVDWVARYERYPKPYAFRRSVREQGDVGVLWRPRDMLMYRRYWARIRRDTRQPEFGDTSLFYLGCYTAEYRAGRMAEVLDLFRALFAGRRILFVGPEDPLGGASFRNELPRLGRIGLRGGEFLAIPREDAFDHYDAILAEIRRRDFDDLFLQAGPTATAMAYELAGTVPGRVLDVGSLNTQVRYLASDAAELAA